MSNFSYIHHKDFYKMNNKEKQNYLNKVKKHIKQNGSALQQKMMNIVTKNIDHYETDFFIHDIYKLEEMKNKNSKFIWLVRSTGTWLIKLDYDFLEEKKDAENFLNAVLAQQEKHDYYIINMQKGSLKKIKAASTAQFTHKFNNKDEHFKKLVDNINGYGINYFTIYKMYGEMKKDIKNESDMINIIRQQTLKAV